jgi:tRNA (cytidine/uridine-2'-O-)-methyltransferase
MAFHIVLYQPEIPPNTGNVIRLAANCGATLHLIEPLGFELDDARLKRAGLDYREWADLRVHADLPACLATTGGNLWAFSTRGRRLLGSARFSPGDVLLFGPETRGLPDELLATLPADAVLRLPMRHGSRSLNLSNAVAIAVYEAWRQIGYAGGE